MPTEMTDAEILAELSPAHRQACEGGDSMGPGMTASTLRQLALARRALRDAEQRASGRTMYDAAAVEREEIAAMVDAAENGWRRRRQESVDSRDEAYWWGHTNAALDLAARIRARKEQADG